MPEKQSQEVKKNQSKSNQQLKRTAPKTSRKSSTKTEKTVKTSTKIVVKSASAKSKSSTTAKTVATTKTTSTKKPKVASQKTTDLIKPTKTASKTKTSKTPKAINGVKAKDTSPKTNKSSKTSKITATAKKELQIQKPTTEQSAKLDTKDASDSRLSVSASEKTHPKTQKSNFGSIFSKIIAGVLSLSSFFFIITLIRLNVLPMHYLLIALVIILTIAGACSFILWHKKSKTPLKILCNIVAIVFSGIYLVGSVYILQVSSFLDDLKPQEYITEQYYVIVKNDSKVQDVAELENKTIGTFDEGIEIYQEAIEKLQETISINLKPIKSAYSMTDSLLSGELDAIFLSAVHESILSEDSPDFNQNTKIIYTIEVEIKLQESEAHPNINVTSEPFTVYISGNDNYGNLAARGLSDVNILATVNPLTYEVLLTSIPRDYFVQLHNIPDAKDKLTHAGMYGIQMSIDTIEDLLDINIDYYVKINFPALISLVDAIGGIDVYSDARVIPLHGDGKIVEEGMNHFDGALTLAFARERFAYETGDRHRAQNQRDVLNSIIKKFSSSTVLLTKTNEILNSVSNNLDTNISKTEISDLVKLQLQNMPSWKIGEFMLDGDDLYTYTYTFDDQLRFVIVPSQKSVQTAHDYITSIIEGKSLSDLNIPTQR